MVYVVMASLLRRWGKTTLSYHFGIRGRLLLGRDGGLGVSRGCRSGRSCSPCPRR